MVCNVVIIFRDDLLYLALYHPLMDGTIIVLFMVDIACIVLMVFIGFMVFIVFTWYHGLYCLYG